MTRPAALPALLAAALTALPIDAQTDERQAIEGRVVLDGWEEPVAGGGTRRRCTGR
jgi:hypothetical protein